MKKVLLSISTGLLLWVGILGVPSVTYADLDCSCVSAGTCDDNLDLYNACVNQASGNGDVVVRGISEGVIGAPNGDVSVRAISEGVSGIINGDISVGGLLNNIGGGGSPVRVERPRSYDANYRGPVFDGPGLIGGAVQVESRIDGNVSRERNLKELIIGWTNFLLSIAAIMAVVALVWAGFLYITAFGDDSRMETAKKIVIWVIGGILLILASYAIVNTVMRAVF